ncbi:MAG: hypothetical protein ACLFVN_13335 [Phycisphaeraceae bacterium]
MNLPKPARRRKPSPTIPTPEAIEARARELAEQRQKLLALLPAVELHARDTAVEFTAEELETLKGV